MLISPRGNVENAHGPCFAALNITVGFPPACVSRSLAIAPGLYIGSLSAPYKNPPSAPRISVSMIILRLSLPVGHEGARLLPFI